MGLNARKPDFGVSGQVLTLNAPIAIKVVCFSRLLKCLRSLYGTQCGSRSDCSGSTLFASILNSSVMLGNYLQQTTSADDIFRCIFFLGALRFKAQTSLVSQRYQNFTWCNFNYYALQTENNKGTDQTVWMSRLDCPYRPSDLRWAWVIVPWFQNMAHHFPRQWAQWTHPF